MTRPRRRKATEADTRAVIRYFNRAYNNEPDPADTRDAKTYFREEHARDGAHGYAGVG